MRRLLAGAAAAGLGLVLVAPAAHAAEKDWDGSHVVTPTSTNAPNPDLVGIFVRKYNSLQRLTVHAYLTPPKDLAKGCPAATEQDLGMATLSAEDSTSGRATVSSSTPCNGTYSFHLDAHLTAGGLSRSDDYTLPGSIDVRVAPPAPTGFSAGINTASIDLTWDKPSNPDPDFMGFRVERAKGDSWEAIAENLPPTATSYSDTAPPAEGGDVTYRVRAMRDATKSPVLSAPTPEKTVTLPTPGKPGDPNDPNGSTTTTKPGAGGGGSTGTTVKPGTGGGSTPIGGRSFKPLPKGQIGVGTKAPRLGTPAASNYSDIVTPDAGFDEELNYGDQSLAGDESEGGEDGLSSFYYEGSGGKGMAKPVAIGSVFLAWALHMRFLAKAARPETAATRRRGRKHTPKRGWA